MCIVGTGCEAADGWGRGKVKAGLLIGLFKWRKFKVLLIDGSNEEEGEKLLAGGVCPSAKRRVAGDGSVAPRHSLPLVGLKSSKKRPENASLFCGAGR